MSHNSDRKSTNANRRTFLKGAGLAGAAGLAGCLSGGGGASDTLTVGALYALSGSVEVIGRPMMNSTELAVKQINDNGGIDGREVELIKRDNGSDPSTGIEEARSLVTQEGCSIVFSAYTSAMRNAITDTFVENEVPLWYPTLYEGGVCTNIEGGQGFSGDINVPKESLEWVWFNNAVPKQQIQPYIPWLMEKEGIESFYLIGSDYVWPQTTNAVIKNFVDENGGSIVQEDYVPLDFTSWGSKLSDISSADPDAVYFTVVGASQVAMIEQAAERGLLEDYPWAGNIMTEQEASSAGDAADGIYTSAPYFNSLDTDESNNYISSYEEEYGTETTPNFIAAASYSAPLMMAQLLEENNADVSTGNEMKSALENETTISAPQGDVTMNPGSHHCTIQSRAGQYDAEAGGFEVLQEFGQITPGGITVDGDCLL